MYRPIHPFSIRNKARSCVFQFLNASGNFNIHFFLQDFFNFDVINFSIKDKI